jgi:hypothetical protein
MAHERRTAYAALGGMRPLVSLLVLMCVFLSPFFSRIFGAKFGKIFRRAANAG